MLFRTIFNVTPHLTHLVIRHSHQALFHPCLSNLPILHMVHVVCLDQDEPANVDVLRTLSSVESLEELSIAVGAIDRVDFCGFPALKKLNVSILSGPPHAMFDGFFSPRLRELSLLNEHYGNSMDIDELLKMSTTLAKCFPAMTDLTLALPLSVREGGSASLASALAPLFPLPLSNFSLYSQRALASPGLTDEFFSTLAQSWPHLLEFSVVIPRASDDDALLSGTTAQSLLSLARGCPRLRTLQLPSMKSPQPEEIGGCAVLQHSLRTLNVDWLAVGRPAVDPGDEGPYRACALLLDKLFPDLDTGGDLCGVTPTDAWKRVLYGVRMCQLGRSNRTPS
ncbi:hypothetical protein GSI_04266 [Ganoderma sinense ZZ0214-1]|uniref:F-box domain-containing protein n=1 Tax=Ganoderma sinense ZZ0214-1 TaxID=1077348 RepID=A0A2G8SIP1_9APHY|nr:hypothetical protein GSI_04266 [Ganoderma sinense ZZ0214-1]